MSEPTLCGVRAPAVAGMFYPRDPEALRTIVEACLEAGEKIRELSAVSRPAGKLRALIAPHAGYRYSGLTAGVAYAELQVALKDVQQVVLLGPTHRVTCRGLVHPGVVTMATPLGEVGCLPVPKSRADAIDVRADVHAQEHSLEVHLPFLQIVAPEAEVLPLAVGLADPNEIADTLAAALAQWPESVVIVSSDLSHYLPYNQAQQTDAVTLQAILAIDYPLAHHRACGAFPVNGLLAYAERMGLVPDLLHACNSGDTQGDKSRVVGYAAVAFWESA